MLYLVFAAVVIVVTAGSLLLVRRHRKADPSRSIDSFHRRLDALDQRGRR
ncbi:MAG: hypothetical protein ACRDJU_15460 [Actinomycetota bacterium]